MDVNEIVQVLEIPHAAAISLYKQDFTSGECLLNWRKVIFNVQKLEKSLANALATFTSTSTAFIKEQKFFSSCLGK